MTDTIENMMRVIVARKTRSDIYRRRAELDWNRQQRDTKQQFPKGVK